MWRTATWVVSTLTVIFPNQLRDRPAFIHGNEITSIYRTNLCYISYLTIRCSATCTMCNSVFSTISSLCSSRGVRRVRMVLVYRFDSFSGEFQNLFRGLFLSVSEREREIVFFSPLEKGTRHDGPSIPRTLIYAGLFTGAGPSQLISVSLARVFSFFTSHAAPLQREGFFRSDAAPSFHLPLPN